MQSMLESRILEAQADRGGLSPNLPAASETQDPESDPSLQTQTTTVLTKEKKTKLFIIFICIDRIGANLF